MLGGDLLVERPGRRTSPKGVRKKYMFPFGDGTPLKFNEWIPKFYALEKVKLRIKYGYGPFFAMFNFRGITFQEIC